MMSKEKAKELVNKYFTKSYILYDDLTWIQAKECALIAVDEIIKSNPIIPLQFMLESEALDKAKEYWEEVKQEIENL